MNPSTVTIDPTADEVLTCSQASAVLPGRPSPSAIWRWMKVGAGPQRIRLQYARIGRKIITSRSALTDFARRLAEADEPIEDTVDQGRTDTPDSMVDKL